MSELMIRIEANADISSKQLRLFRFSLIVNAPRSVLVLGEKCFLCFYANLYRFGFESTSVGGVGFFLVDFGNPEVVSARVASNCGTGGYQFFAYAQPLP